MAIKLTDYVWTAKVVKAGQADAVSIPPGKSLKIETLPAGEEVLDITCPQGKSWMARIIVEIVETDA